MSLKNYFAIGFMGVIVWIAYGVFEKRQAEIAQVVKEHNLDEVQLAAYKACDSQMSGKQLNPQNPNIKVFNGSVPISICACQAKEMVKVMLPGNYSSHRRIVKSITNGEKDIPTELIETQVVSRYSPSVAFTKLQRSLLSCISDYRVEREAQQRETIRKICNSPGTRDTHLCRS